ncbi:MAG: immune inhibitor A [Bdellovibrionota bacterium]
MWHNINWITVFTVNILIFGSCNFGKSHKKPNPSDQLNPDKQLTQVVSEIGNTRSALEEKRKGVEKAKASGQSISDADRNRLVELEKRIATLEKKFSDKQKATSLPAMNTKVLSIPQALEGHTDLHSFAGTYKILVIPVEFQDVKFDDRHFFTSTKTKASPAQEYLFGDNENSMTQYYKHASLGKFNLAGNVVSPVTVSGNLADYGEAVPGNTDKNARGLVVDALKAVRDQGKNDIDWSEYDLWDLYDYDKDGHYHEPDGFIDAVVLIYAGKSQASCQATFDSAGSRPATSEVPETDPRYDAIVECYNRIWPHRSGIFLDHSSDDYSENGPVVEGINRPAFGGLKLSETVFATDYNMQSEYSDRSTFMHEFGHSIGLPDVYAMRGSNSVQEWDLMANNAPDEAQELSSYNKYTLGWLKPKVIKQGQDFSAYLGAYNFISAEHREHLTTYNGPKELSAEVDGKVQSFDITATVPEFGEPVYRSIVALTNGSVETVPVTNLPEIFGKFSAYSGKYDDKSKSYKINVLVPIEGDATLSFDTKYAIETETNFTSTEEKIRVVTDYDLGKVLINDEVFEELRTISGDENYDSLAEENPDCEADRVIELRLKKIKSELNQDEQSELNEKLTICQTPVWQTKKYDLTPYKGQIVEFSINLTTDAAYTEFGIVFDNIRIGDKMIENFESAEENLSTPFKIIENGNDRIAYNQFYLFEYRVPGEDFGTASYNKDNNIGKYRHSMFIGVDPSNGPEQRGFNIIPQYRMIEANAQPGVLVWYFNAKYNRRENNPEYQEGKGYLLVLNSEIKDLPLPGPFADGVFKDDQGFYDRNSFELNSLIALQRSEFICFSHTKYNEYQTGIAPDCSNYDDIDVLEEITKDGLGLMYRRKRINLILPSHRKNFISINVPFFNTAGARSIYSTFRPTGSASHVPFKAYKIETDQNNDMKLIPDIDITNTLLGLAPVSSFDDKDNNLADRDGFVSDSVVVEKKGFSFKVVNPNGQIIKRFNGLDPNENSYEARRPRAKLIFQWKNEKHVE